MKKLALILLIINHLLFAKEVTYLARSPIALLMGDAYTAAVDDEYVLFYNPAALGGNKNVSITPLNPQFGITNIYSDMNKFSNLPTGTNAPAQIASKFMDYPIYLGASAFPTIKMGQFAMTLFLNNQTQMTIRNATHPILDINYRYDRGFVTGFAYNIGQGATTSKIKKSKKKQTTAGQRFSIGASIKHLNRQGIDNQYDLFGTSLISSLTTGASVSGIKSALGYATGDAWGADLGVEYAYFTSRSQFKAGYSLLDVANTRFTKTEGTANIPIQPMFANAGISFKQDYTLFDYTLAMDLHPLLGPVDLARQLHLGAELSIPFISVFGGISEGYLSYGASMRFWPFKLTAGLYGVEQGASYRQAQAKRFILYLSLFDFSIDI